VFYPRPLHLQAVYKSLGYRPGDLPVSERVAQEVLSLPIYPGMPATHVDHVCAALRSAVPPVR
jgi:dTDP-4-amino-4,6-dideoxygalactose transaminase